MSDGLGVPLAPGKGPKGGHEGVSDPSLAGIWPVQSHQACRSAKRCVGSQRLPPPHESGQQAYRVGLP
ncbi:hypothetical protein NL676_007361 [Syzygium grande]|nr:hypothetical protein NL676_007361 [Syzygium grande]